MIFGWRLAGPAGGPPRPARPGRPQSTKLPKAERPSEHERVHDVLSICFLVIAYAPRVPGAPLFSSLPGSDPFKLLLGRRL